jgi:hypothetical protein
MTNHSRKTAESIPLEKAGHFPSREVPYPEEQLYEDFTDFDELYGPDAYLGDQYAPFVSSGSLYIANPFGTLELSDEIRQEKRLELEASAAETLASLEKESVRGVFLPEA